MRAASFKRLLGGAPCLVETNGCKNLPDERRFSVYVRWTVEGKASRQCQLQASVCRRKLRITAQSVAKC